MTADSVRSAGKRAWRRYKTDGVPSTGPYDPQKEGAIDVFVDEVADTLGALDTKIDNATISGDSITRATWAQLSAITGVRLGQSGRVTNDAGTHTDPVAGGTVANKGEYAWSASPAGWQRMGDLGYFGGKVPNSQLADVPTATFKGRMTAGTGSPEDLTVAQAKNALGVTPLEAAVLGEDIGTVAGVSTIFWDPTKTVLLGYMTTAGVVVDYDPDPATAALQAAVFGQDVGTVEGVSAITMDTSGTVLLGYVTTAGVVVDYDLQSSIEKALEGFDPGGGGGNVDWNGDPVERPQCYPSTLHIYNGVPVDFVANPNALGASVHVSGCVDDAAGSWWVDFAKEVLSGQRFFASNGRVTDINGNRITKQKGPLFVCQQLGGAKNIWEKVEIGKDLGALNSLDSDGGADDHNEGAINIFDRWNMNTNLDGPIYPLVIIQSSHGTSNSGNWMWRSNVLDAKALGPRRTIGVVKRLTYHQGFIKPNGKEFFDLTRASSGTGIYRLYRSLDGCVSIADDGVLVTETDQFAYHNSRPRLDGGGVQQVWHNNPSRAGQTIEGVTYSNKLVGNDIDWDFSVKSLSGGPISADMRTTPFDPYGPNATVLYEPAAGRVTRMTDMQEPAAGVIQVVHMEGVGENLANAVYKVTTCDRSSGAPVISTRTFGPVGSTLFYDPNNPSAVPSGSYKGGGCVIAKDKFLLTRNDVNTGGGARGEVYVVDVSSGTPVETMIFRSPVKVGRAQVAQMVYWDGAALVSRIGTFAVFREIHRYINNGKFSDFYMKTWIVELAAFQ